MSILIFLVIIYIKSLFLMDTHAKLDIGLCLLESHQIRFCVFGAVFFLGYGDEIVRFLNER